MKKNSQLIKTHPYYDTPLKEKAMWLEMKNPYTPRYNRKNFYIIFFNDSNVVKKRDEILNYDEFKEWYIGYVKGVYNISYSSDNYDYFKRGYRKRRK